MAEMLIRAVDKASGTGIKGELVALKANNDVYGLKETLPQLCKLKVPEASMRDLRSYFVGWYTKVDYTVVNQNIALDGFRIKVFSTTQGVSGDGNITRNMVESPLNKWNALVVSTAPNEVIFDFKVYDAAISEAFWHVNTSAIVFTELNYDEGAGIHTIRGDFSAIGNNPSYIESMIEEGGGIVTSHINKVITFTMDRAVVLQEFKSYVRQFVNTNMIRKRKFYVPSVVVDAIIANGGEYTATPAQFLSYVKDKEND